MTHITSDPLAPDFLFIFLAGSVSRNNDRTQAYEGSEQQTWAPYLSTDGGETWKPASNDLADVEPTVLSMIVEGGRSVLWVGTAGQGLWRSDNGGRSWRPAFVQGLEDRRTVALTQDARGHLYLLTLDNSRYPDAYLFTSTDGGYNWNQRLAQRFSASPATLITDLVADPFQSGRLYAVTSGGLLYTEDGGLNWQQAAVPLPADAFPGGETVLAVDPTQRGRMYLINRSTNLDGTDQISVLQSVDSGISWKTLPAQFGPPRPTERNPHLFHLRLDPLNRRQLFLASDDGLWISKDAGLTWQPASTALAGTTVADVLVHPQQRGRWFAIGSGGIWRTANAGSQWRALGQGLPPTSQIRSLVAVPAQAGALVALNGGPIPIDGGTQPVWQSDDNGDSWMPAMAGLSGITLTKLYVGKADPGMVYGVAAQGVAHSEDGGRSWHLASLAATPTQLALSRTPGHLFAATAAGLWQSNDNGSSWLPTDLGGPVSAVATASSGDVVAIADRGEGMRVWRSRDNGASWTEVGAPPAGDIAVLQVHPNIEDYLILLMRWGGLQISLDGGHAWTRSDSGIPAGVHWRAGVPEQPTGPNLAGLLIDPLDPLQWWVGRDGGGIFHSTDNGRTWSDASTDLGDNLAFDFSRSGSDLLAGSTVGVLRQSTTSPQEPPAAVDARIEILWPHDYATVGQATHGNLGLRLYAGRTQEVPPCAWTPVVDVWMARDAQPLRRQDMAIQRTMEGHPFPFWELNDLDVTWANQIGHQLIFMAVVSPGLADSAANVWVHAADARTSLPDPPQAEGLTPARPGAIDALIRVVWPHDEGGQFIPPAQANLVNISAVLFARDTRLALAPDYLPERVWLVGAIDNQVGRRLLVGEPSAAEGNGFRYTTYEFNNVDVSLARDPSHHWTFWLEVPGADAASNVWVHGIDARTSAPQVLEPIAGCLP